VRHLRELIAAVRSDEAARGVKILAGGYPFNVAPGLWREIGADASAADAAGAVAALERASERARLLREALDDVLAGEPPPRLVVPSPAGRPFTQRLAIELAAQPRLVFACGRYEGIDQRVIDDAADRVVVDEISIGDYVLVGGEVAVLVMIEAIARLLPGVLGNPASAMQDSFSDGLLEAPCYTRPEIWRGRAVPAVLRSGNHAAIARWRRDRAVERTATRRPDLLAALPPDALDSADRALLEGLAIPPS
jgi:tRNA (guanine37-N1)-methyltransferase